MPLQLGSALPGAPPSDSVDVAGRHGASDVDELASAIAARATSLRDDKTAKKIVKKKALTDLLKALPKFGIRSARKAVPESQRTPAAWFREAPLAKPACLPLLGAAAEEAFAAADAYYFRSMARVQRLRVVRGAAHSDLSAREVDTACGAVEHLLHLLRGQRRNVAAAGEAEGALALAAEAIEGLRVFATAVTAAAEDGDAAEEGGSGGSGGGGGLQLVAVPPPQRATRGWLLRQRALLDRLVAAASAARLVHKAVSAAESTPSLRPGGPGAAAALNAAATAASEARAKLDRFLTPALEAAAASSAYKTNSNGASGGEGGDGGGAWVAPPLVTAALRDTLAANFDELRAVAARIEGAFDAAVAATAAAPTAIEVGGCTS